MILLSVCVLSFGRETSNFYVRHVAAAAMLTGDFCQIATENERFQFIWQQLLLKAFFFLLGWELKLQS